MLWKFVSALIQDTKQNHIYILHCFALSRIYIFFARFSTQCSGEYMIESDTLGIAELTSDETDHLVNWSEPTTKDQWWRWINLMGEVYWWISGGWSRKRRGGLPRLHCSKRPPHPPPPPSPSPCPPSPPPPPLLLAVGIIRWACSHAECRTSWFLRKNIWQTVNPPNITGCKKYWGWIVNHQILLDGLWLSWVEAILGRPNIYSKKYWVHNIGLLTTKYC